MTSSMDDSDDEFDQLAPPDNELDKVRAYTSILYSRIFWKVQVFDNWL